MPIEPAVVTWLERAMRLFAAATGPTPAEHRAAIEATYTALMADYPIAPDARLNLVAIREQELPTGWGEVALRIMAPPVRAPRPVFLHLFGGAWWQRTFDAPDVVDMCRQIALEAGIVVVQVDYALAPEHPYPVALEQAYATLMFIADGELPEADPTRIAVGGISAGANLASALTLLARDRGGPAIALQVLEVPVLDLTLAQYDHSVYGAFPAVDGLDRPSSRTLRQAVEWYLGDADATRPYVSPLWAADLTGLPEALILTAEFDPLWAEGTAYACALVAAGTPATAVRYAGQIHSAPSLSAISASACRWRTHVIDALRQFSRDSDP